MLDSQKAAVPIARQQVPILSVPATHNHNDHVSWMDTTKTKTRRKAIRVPTARQAENTDKVQDKQSRTEQMFTKETIANKHLNKVSGINL